MNLNLLLFFGASLGFSSLVIGALGDHALSISPQDQKGFATALRYHMFYAGLITVLALIPTDKWRHVSGYIFTFGLILFSGSLYAAYIFNISWMVYLTPFGGLSLMSAWLLLAVTAFRNRQRVNS